MTDTGVFGKINIGEIRLTKERKEVFVQVMWVHVTL